MSTSDERLSEAETPATSATHATPAAPSRKALLWSGGKAAAAVGAGVAIVGYILIRGVLNIDILGTDGAMAIVGFVAYLAFVVLIALGATALMRILLQRVPRPRVFFLWIVGVFTAILVLLPLLTDQPFSKQLGVGFLNLITLVSIGALVNMTADAAIHKNNDPKRKWGWRGRTSP